MPNLANPQDLNRYSYVRNNPVRYVDPTGHVCTDPEDPTPTCFGTGTTRVGKTMITGNGAEVGAAKNLTVVVKKTTTSGSKVSSGGGDKALQSLSVDTGDQPGGNSSDFFSEIAYVADNVGAVASDIEAVVVDTIGAIVIAEGCLTGVGCGPAIVYAVAIDMGVSLFSPFGVVENLAGGVAAGATAISDWLNGTTYIRFDAEGGYQIGIGRDTVVSVVNAVAGLVPEANYDAWISNQQLEYDNLRRSGELPTISQFEFYIPPTPNLWGEGWPNELP